MQQFLNAQHQQFLNNSKGFQSNPLEQNSDMIDETDDQNYDDIQAHMTQQIDGLERTITPQILQKLESEPLSSLKLSRILDEFACSICQCTTKEPMVIKHCLHFFCKACIDNYVLRYKKECPLCKVQLRTKRETRFYDKLDFIMHKLRQQISKTNENDQIDLEWAMKNNLNQQKQAKEVQEKRISMEIEESGSNSFNPLNIAASQESDSWAANEIKENSKRKSIKLDEDGKSKPISKGHSQPTESQLQRLGPGDHFEDDDQKRIQETVDKLRQNQLRIQKLKESKQQQQDLQDSNSRANLNYGGSQIDLQALQLDQVQPMNHEQQFFMDYQKLVTEIKQVKQINYPKISFEMPVMDIQIKVMFDEDLQSMIFPKVQELEFRANSQSPIEICAKILANQNGHKDKWQNYQFAYCKQSKKLNEVTIEDLRKTFAQLREKNDQDKLVLFYKIRDIKKILVDQ